MISEEQTRRLLERYGQAISAADLAQIAQCAASRHTWRTK
jgi:hypothetical protein